MFIKFNFNSLKYKIVLSLLGFNLSFAQNKEVKDVTCEGYGRDINEAAQNCAENALTNVVGSFIDTSSSLEVRTNISNGIKNQTRFIKKDVKEYSQGVIQKFEILKISTEKLYKVNAKVSVRIEDFKYYVKKLAEAEVNVNEGLFAQIKTEKNQNSNGAAIVYKKILSPLVRGEVIDFNLSPPKPLSAFKNLDQPNNINYGNFTEFKNFNKNLFIVGFHVNVQVKNEYLINTKKILNSISSNKIDYGTVNQNNKYYVQLPPLQISPQEEDVYIIYSDRSDNLNGYLINSIKSELEKNTIWLSKFGTSSTSPKSEVPVPLLTLSIYDNNSSVLQQERLQDAYFPHLQSRRYFIYDLAESYGPVFNSPWSLVGAIQIRNGQNYKSINTFMIRDSNQFILFVAVNENTLKNAKVINLKISQ